MSLTIAMTSTHSFCRMQPPDRPLQPATTRPTSGSKTCSKRPYARLYPAPIAVAVSAPSCTHTYNGYDETMDLHVEVCSLFYSMIFVNKSCLAVCTTVSLTWYIFSTIWIMIPEIRWACLELRNNAWCKAALLAVCQCLRLSDGLGTGIWILFRKVHSFDKIDQICLILS